MSHATSDAHILVSMTYASRANPDVSVKDFETILQQAQINNAANGITGMLVLIRITFCKPLKDLGRKLIVCCIV